MNEPRSPSPLERAAAPALALFSLAVLAFALRGGMPGVPVADDYRFLAQQAMQRTDWFGTHGAVWYWRPVSRQLYFGMLGAHMIDHPGVAFGVHMALLLVTFAALWSFARRTLGRAGAVVLASSVLLMEPMRVLLAWPSAAQHLLTLAALSCALAAAAACRRVPAWLAMALAIGSHENALLALPLVTVLLARGEGGSLRRDGSIACALAAAWALLRQQALAHGAGVPPVHGMPAAGALFDVARRSLAAFAGLEDLGRVQTWCVLAGYALLGVAVWRARAGNAEPRLRARLLAGHALVLWALAVAPLALLLPDWNSWRSTLPSLALAIGFASLVSAGGMRAALLAVALRAAALALAPVPAAAPGAIAPATASHLSYARLTRMQRTVQAAHRALSHAVYRTRPPRVRHWNTPRLAEFGFSDSRALQCWTHDPGAQFLLYGESEGMLDTAATVVAFDPESAQPAVLLTAEAQRRLFAATRALSERGSAAADSLLATVEDAQEPSAARLHALVLLNRVSLNLQLGRIARADSLHQRSRTSAWADQWLRDEARIALALRDTARVRAALREVLVLTPDDERARAAAKAFGVNEPGTNGAAHGR